MEVANSKRQAPRAIPIRTRTAVPPSSEHSFELRDVQAKLHLLSEDNVEATLESETRNLGGCTVDLQCRLQKGDKGVISDFFVLCTPFR
ncbi:hypothetical protein MTO96_029997 [Rhipicephalus appendiculatus]